MPIEYSPRVECLKYSRKDYILNTSQGFPKSLHQLCLPLDTEFSKRSYNQLLKSYLFEELSIQLDCYILSGYIHRKYILVDFLHGNVLVGKKN